MTTIWEARIGSLVAATGVIWVVQAGTLNYHGMQFLSLPVGPLEICGIGILIWLHARWRRSVILK